MVRKGAAQSQQGVDVAGRADGDHDNMHGYVLNFPDSRLTPPGVNDERGRLVG
jgi:hypothetical protein